MAYKNNLYDDDTSFGASGSRQCSNNPFGASQMVPSFNDGIPAGFGMNQQPAAITSAMPAQQIPGLVQVPGFSQTPPTVESTMFTPGFLRTQIGKRMRVEFLIGTTAPLIDRTGTLVAVGASYILLRPIDSPNIMYCDIYSIKFITILQF